MKKLQKLIDDVEAAGFGLVPWIDDDGAVVFDVGRPGVKGYPHRFPTVAEVEAFLIGVKAGRAQPAAT